MEVKEAPKKIYIPIDNTIESEFLEDYWVEFPVSGQEVEYTCTDAFIEKACKWLKDNKNHSFIGCEDPCLSGYLTDEFINEFKKAMEE